MNLVIICDQSDLFVKSVYLFGDQIPDTVLLTFLAILFF